MDYKIIKSWRKTMAIQIKNWEVIVRVPKLVPKIMVESFVRKHEKWIESKLKNRPKIVKLENVLSAEKIKETKILAKKYMVERWEYWAEKFNKDVKAFKITSAKTRRWSCTSQRNINLTYRLMFTHSKAIDYVIIHELAHLKHMNHSRAFWNHVEEMMPDYKEWHHWLKKEGRNIW